MGRQGHRKATGEGIGVKRALSPGSGSRVAGPVSVGVSVLVGGSRVAEGSSRSHPTTSTQAATRWPHTPSLPLTGALAGLRLTPMGGAEGAPGPATSPRLPSSIDLDWSAPAGCLSTAGQNCGHVLGDEAPGRQGATRAHSRSYVTEEMG